MMSMQADGSSRAQALDALNSPDPRTRADAVEALAAMGAGALIELTTRLHDPSAQVRAAAADALARISAPATESAFAQALNDPDERVRSHAARGLARIRSPRALDACLKTLNDNPDELHLDITPSAAALADMGLPAARAVVEPMLSPDEMTRLRAQGVLQRIVAARHGFRTGEGFPNRVAEEAARAAWIDNGNYDYRDPPSLRERSVERWREWLKEAKD